MSLTQIAEYYGFTTAAELFQYFADTYYNGNFSQLEELARKLNKTDRANLLTYLKDTEQEEVREKAIELFL